MDKKTISLFGITIDNLTFDQILEKIKRGLSGKPAILPVFSINPEIVILAQKQPTFKKILNNAYLRLPDGIGIILAARLLGVLIYQRTTGIELLKKLAKKSLEWSITIGLIGGKPQVAIKAGECLSKANLGLKCWAEEGPIIKVQSSKFKVQSSKSHLPFTIYHLPDPNDENLSYNFEALIEKINRTHTSILFCAFGAPKQEYFIEELKRHERKLNQSLVTVSVGGAFDEIAHLVSPAPEWIDKLGFKWLWRLVHEPWRLKRQMRLISFIYLIFLTRIANLKKAILKH